MAQSSYERALLDEAADKRFTQKDVALSYALAMRWQDSTGEEIKWSVVNEAIIQRWSIAGLVNVKKLAWARMEGQS